MSGTCYIFVVVDLCVLVVVDDSSELESIGIGHMCGAHLSISVPR